MLRVSDTKSLEDKKQLGKKDKELIWVVENNFSVIDHIDGSKNGEKMNL